jgi:alpha-glucuronidase
MRLQTLFCRTLLLLALGCTSLFAEDGYRLWLRYEPVEDASLRDAYRREIAEIVVPGESATAAVIRKELSDALMGMLGEPIAAGEAPSRNGAVIAGTPESCPAIRRLDLAEKLKELGSDGYLIRSTTADGFTATVIASQSEIGALYGTFHFLRLLQTRQPIAQLEIAEKPAYERRMLNHWDNPRGDGERMYSGRSLWKWRELPEKIDPRYLDYARANASLGINGMAPNNVNAKAASLSSEYLKKTAALADALRPYGIRVYLSARFSAPIELGGLKTADPLDAQVAAWWKKKADEIYRLIPDFGGFVVKADSEGQPGPQQYGRTHADGANVLADAVAPHGGAVLWRAFVYDADVDPDRVKRAYLEFVPLDGKFRANVIVQVKNGPLDFQPREPFHPLYGAMPKTPLMPELQITQEYLGHSTHLVFLGPLWKEFFDSDTYAGGPGGTVAKVTAGKGSGIVGVANTGSDRNWCGHHFAQANWYAFGRLAWNPGLSSEQIADEWIRMTWSNDVSSVAAIRRMMLASWEAAVNYMMPLGLNILHRGSGYYEPNPEMRQAFHGGDKTGLGIDRTERGSNAVGQYRSPLKEKWNDLKTCDEKFLCWFHHVPWDYRMASGRTFWEELAGHYGAGVETVAEMKAAWQKLGQSGAIDPERHAAVAERLDQQHKHAQIWKEKCLGYFGKLAGR